MIKLNHRKEVKGKMRRMQKRQDAKLKLLILALQLVKEILVLAYLVLDRLLD